MPIMLNRTTIRDIPLFSRLSPAHLDQVQQLLRNADYQPGDIVIEEGSPSACLLYVIIEGEAVLCKKGHSPLSNQALEYELEVRGKHEIFGWISVLDGQPLPMRVMAKTPLTLAILDLKKAPGSPAAHIRNVLLTELRHYLSTFVRTSLATRVADLQQEAEFARYRNAVGSIVITTLALLSFYTLLLSLLPRFQSLLEVNFALSPIIIIFFFAFFFPVIEHSGFPPAFFGLRTDNWRHALTFSVGWTLVFLAILVLLKWLVIETVPRLHGLSVINFSDIRVGAMNDTNTYWYWIAVSIYLLLTPLQEFVARCGVQAPLYAFLQGSEFKRAGLSIVVSNMVFAAVHAHIGGAFAAAAFIPGIFWGWIFLRTNSLLAATVSHLMIGGAAIFLLGIEEFIQALAS
jgi:membrane protease YdiL (CAAX protease family)/CRP-like cAMP-binding protein